MVSIESNNIPRISPAISSLNIGDKMVNRIGPTFVDWVASAMNLPNLFIPPVLVELFFWVRYSIDQQYIVI